GFPARARRAFACRAPPARRPCPHPRIFGLPPRSIPRPLRRSMHVRLLPLPASVKPIPALSFIAQNHHPRPGVTALQQPSPRGASRWWWQPQDMPLEPLGRATNCFADRHPLQPVVVELGKFLVNLAVYSRIKNKVE